MKENSEKIALFYLPSCSPDKNPDEYLNSDLKYGLSEKPAPKTQGKLKESHMNMLQKNSNKVKKYFNHKSIKYTA